MLLYIEEDRDPLMFQAHNDERILLIAFGPNSWLSCIISKQIGSKQIHVRTLTRASILSKSTIWVGTSKQENTLGYEYKLMTGIMLIMSGIVQQTVLFWWLLPNSWDRFNAVSGALIVHLGYPFGESEKVDGIDVLLFTWTPVICISKVNLE